ncbi:MAG: ABC transporter permease [Acidobacteria bacterium SCN 69-37]|nr:MAG: ABC transporter permease [Acidobacteria bacterium SCN 69-37]
MSRFVLRRLLQSVLTFFGATLIIYALMFSVTTDPLQALAGERPLSPSQRAQLTAQYHLDEPFLVQYGYYMRGLLTGDMGRTITGRQITDVLAEAWPRTLQLTAITMLIVIVFGVTGGVFAGLRRGGVFDQTTLAITLIVIGTPVFVLGTVFQTVFAVELGWFRPSFAPELGIATYVLPAIVIGLLSLATTMRLTRTSVAENLRADYVRTANAKGLTRNRVVGVHVLRNSLIPVITFLATELGGLMSGAMVTEGIFNIPGVGGRLFQGIRLEDGPLVVTIVSLIILIYLVSNLVVDVLYAVLDPRIRHE